MSLGFRVVSEFARSSSGRPRAERLEATRDAASAFRMRFADQGRVHAVRSHDVVSFACPARLALGASHPMPSWVTLVARMLIVQFEDFDGDLRTLVWNPTLAGSLARTPSFAGRPRQPATRRFAGRLAPRQLSSVRDALERCGLAPEDVDFVASAELRGQDLRSLAGTTRAPVSEHHARVPIFPTARLLVRAGELEALRAPHPVQKPSYVANGAEDMIVDRLTILGDDVELGLGVALLRTPGVTADHQSLVLNTADGIWVVSGNAVASDCWQPLMSKIPGLRQAAERDGREVVSGDALDALDLYDAMVLERSLADVSRLDPRWLTILPSRELAARRHQWPATPTFSHGVIGHGAITLPRRDAARTRGVSR